MMNNLMQQNDAPNANPRGSRAGVPQSLHIPAATNATGFGGRAGVILDQSFHPPFSTALSSGTAKPLQTNGVNPNVLLSPEHFIQTSRHQGGTGHMPPMANMNQYLVDVDISASNFTKAINFESLNGGTSQMEDVQYNAGDDEYMDQSLADTSKY